MRGWLPVVLVFDFVPTDAVRLMILVDVDSALVFLGIRNVLSSRAVKAISGKYIQICCHRA